MSRIIAGQLRLLEESSRVNAEHMGMAFDGKNPPAPKSKLQDHPNEKKGVNNRGKGDGQKGEIKGTANLVKNSTYNVPFEYFSVGFDLLKEDAKDLDKTRKILRKGKRNIIHPDRMGKKDKSGMSLPNNKISLPPKKLSNIVKKQGKKTIKKIKDKKIKKEHKEEHKINH